MKSFTQIGTEVGELVEQKNAAYGSSFEKSGAFLALLWPNGIPAERYGDALLLVRIFDKQMRIATDQNAFGESPYGDITGYGILGVSLHQKRDQGCGSANGLAAVDGLKERNNSAQPSADVLTMPSASERKEPTSKPPSSSPATPGSEPTAAPAPTATAAASEDEVDRERRAGRRLYLPQGVLTWLDRSLNSQCCACTQKLSNYGPFSYVQHRQNRFIYCSPDCGQFLLKMAKEMA